MLLLFWLTEREIFYVFFQEPDYFLFLYDTQNSLLLENFIVWGLEQFS
jgi:hypothetical protein